MIQEESKIIDLLTLSSSFPKDILNEIQRDNMIDAIEDIFKEKDIVFVKGDTGFGKTVLLKQFCQKYYKNSISLFINPFLSSSYNIDLVTHDLYSQIKYYLDNSSVSINDSQQMSKIIYGKILRELKINSRSRNKDVYFVIDGLDHITQEEGYIISDIINDLLPIGSSKIKLLFSSEKDRIIGEVIKLDSNYEELRIVGLTDEEVGTIFNTSKKTYSVEEISSVRSYFRGNPQKIQQFKKIYDEKDVVDIELELSSLPQDLFEVEWRNVDTSNDTLMKILAIITFDNHINNYNTIQKHLRIDRDIIIKSINTYNFFEIDKYENISFYSEYFRKGIAIKLEGYKVSTINLLIDDILEKNEDEELSFLPDYYEKTERYEELLNFLDNKNFARILLKSETMSSISTLIKKGLSISNKINNESNLFKFSLENSIVKQKYNKSWQSEIDALVSLKEEDKALLIAQDSPLLEDKIQMLSLIARRQKEYGKSPSEDIIEEIKLIYQRLDPENLGTKGVEIAADLIYVNPDMAIELVEKAYGIKNEGNSLDKALVAMTMASLNKSDEVTIDTTAIGTIKEKLKDPEIKEFFNDFYFFIGKYSPKELLQEIHKINSLNTKVDILASWCESNEDAVDESVEIVKYIFELITSNNEYKTNAGIYRKISEQLKVLNIESIKTVLPLFYLNLTEIKLHGPTIEYVLLMLNLIKAKEKNLMIEEVKIEFIDLYFYINEIEDISIKLEAISHYYKCLLDLEMKIKLEESEGLLTSVEDDIEVFVCKILNDTASQMVELNKAVRILSPLKPIYILELISKVNITYNREFLYHTFANSLLEVDVTLDVYEKVITSLGRIEHYQDVYDDIVLSLIKALYKYSDQLDKIWYSKLFSLINVIDRVAESRVRLESLNYMYIIMKQHNLFSSKNPEINFINKIKQNWDDIDIIPRKVEIGFDNIKLVSPYSIKLAREYQSIISDYRNKDDYMEIGDCLILIHSLKLLIRSYKGLLLRTKNHDFSLDQDYKEIKKLIQQVPSNGERALLWSEMYTACFAAGYKDTANSIASLEIKTNIERISDSDRRYKGSVIQKTAPCLYFSHEKTALILFNSLPEDEKDTCFNYICEFIYTKNNYYEPFDSRLVEGFDLSYEEIIDICELVMLMTNDSLQFKQINTIIESINNKTYLSKEQKNHIRKRLLDIIESQFPSKINIKHNGYKLVSLARLSLLSQNNTKELEEYEKLAEEIPNTTDKLFTKTVIATSYKHAKINKMRELLSSVEAELINIESINERISQVEFMAEKVQKKDKILNQKYIKLGLDYTKFVDGKDKIETEKRLIDLAYQMNEDFAKSLVSSLKGDGRSKQVQGEIDERVAFLELKNKIIGNKNNSDEKDLKDISKLKNIGWSMLGSLNANRVAPKKFEDLIIYLKKASYLPIEESFPIYSWVIENNNIKYVKQKNAKRDFIREVFNAVLVACKFTLIKAGATKDNLRNIKNLFQVDKEEGILVERGKRDLAIGFIEEWVQESTEEYIKICDPYFQKSDLEFIQLLRGINENIEFQVLTSRKIMNQEISSGNFKEEFIDYWKLNIADQSPPETNIVIAGTTTDGSLPIHDRWIISKNSGLRLGTSLNSLGKGKDSEINILSETNRIIIEEKIDGYLIQQKRFSDKEKMEYYSFWLD
ncbi:hypothetical protein [Carnobacterium inhibens]|uniref:NACHT domain-containing protein n=2 Tax=Carnobacterium inhibens TaxID=147709 RepID=U5SCK3_9LACT|nr:hypothetical protein [Carnobacterium inhibens]AGY82970.1 hypothetical protein Q783_11725 [Carnobacterium inhibens subsp. gilichinskyi]MBC9826237.1 hypothetical protein [Carnobacterium inhibens]